MRKTIITSGLLLLAARWADAGLVSVRLASELEKQADTIVVGSLIDVTPTSNGIQFHLSVIRTIKGNLGPVETISVVSTDLRDSSHAAAPPLRGNPPALWFLKSSSLGSFTLVPAQSGDADLQHMGLFVESAVPAGLYAYTQAEASIDRVAKEVCAFAENRRFVESEDQVVQGLQGIQSVSVVGILKYYAKSNDPQLRAIGLASLIQRNDAQSLVQLEGDLHGVFAANAFQRSTGILNISAAIELLYRGTDVSGIQALERMAAGNGLGLPRLQRACLYALRSLHTKDTLPFLVQMLASSDVALRYDALYGIASFANGFPIVDSRNLSRSFPHSSGPFATKETSENLPGFQEFSRNEAKYLGFWKDWWTRSAAILH
jgi:hypothetical protein